MLDTWLRLKKNPEVPILVTERSIAAKTVGGELEWAVVSLLLQDDSKWRTVYSPMVGLSCTPLGIKSDTMALVRCNLKELQRLSRQRINQSLHAPTVKFMMGNVASKT